MDFMGYSMRPIEDEDMDILLFWRNQDRIRNRMLNKHIITRLEHEDWFEKVKNEKLKKHFVFLNENIKLGYISFFNFNNEMNSYSIGVYLGELRDNPLDGIYLYVLTTEYGFNELNADFLNEETFCDNLSALEISRYLGYKDIRKDENIMYLSMDKTFWDKEGKMRF